jgi:tetratricopeptide (TPR) repeat protein
LPLDREDTLKKAEKLLRQGRLDPAIAEYLRVVEDQPRDWATANTLGDLYVRAGQPQKAAAQYTRIADHFMREGFYPKAAAIFKKVLKITPDDEASQVKLAELSTMQGLLADAKAHWNAIAARRRARGDQLGAAEIVVRLGELDPGDFDARFAGARTLVELGDTKKAAVRFRELYSDLLDKGRNGEAIAALRQAVELDPADKDGRTTLARSLIETADYAAARQYLDRETAGDDPLLLFALLEMELKSGQLDSARELIQQLFATDQAFREKVLELGWPLTAKNMDAAYVCAEAVVEASAAASEFGDAAAVLQEFLTRVPGHVPSLLRLIELCVDGGLEETMYETQAQLTDAYLASGQAAEARVISEDLVAREPWERAHIERFRRALVMLRVSDPDTVIAERLSGQAPFTAHDPFADLGTMPIVEAPPEPAPVPAEPEPVPAKLPEPVAEEPHHAVPEPAKPPAPATPHVGDAGTRSGNVEIDLTSVLGDLHGMELPEPRRAPKGNLEEVFKDFRDDAARQTRPDQSAQHMTLARTYLQMGMEEEAITSLRVAARWPRQRFEAASILGRLYQKRGETEAALEWLERASEAPAPTPDEGYALLYDLGTLLESAGETARALAVFLELQADAGEYRDVSARVDRLARVQTGG